MCLFSMKRKFFVIRMKSVITWGKYIGKTFKWITENDPDYVIWVAKKIKITLRFSHDIIKWYEEQYGINLIHLRLNLSLPCMRIPISDN